MKRYKLIFLYILGLISYSCGGGGGDDPPPPPVVTPPSAAILQFPANGAECTEGINPTATQSTINFQWNHSNNTDSYDLIVKNLISGSSTTYSTVDKQKSVTLQKGTPFSWKVISKSTTTTQTATSSVWKFYNAGDGVTSYPPFPAEIVSPTMGESVIATGNQITLKWTGSDVENDISGYDVYFGTASNPALYKSNNTTTELANVSVVSGTVYYWKIVTKDSKGNTSSTSIYNFRVN